MKDIGIDIDVHRAIEAGRLSFEESANAILRRLLGIDAKPAAARPPGSIRQPRSSGAYQTVLGKVVVEGNSLKELLSRVLLVAERLQPGFLRRLAETSTARGRRIVARSAEQLYPKTPHLAEYGERLDETWWFDTNVGRNQVLATLRVIAKLLRLDHLPSLQKRSQKSAILLEDILLSLPGGK